MKNTSWTDDEITFLKENYSHMTNAQMAAALDRTKTAVDLKLNRLGINKSKYTYNQNYFENINSADKAYWLGFIAADGYVVFKDTSEYRNYELGVELQYRDRNHLKLFNKSLCGNVQVDSRERISYFDPSQTHHTAFIRLYSKKLVEDLINHGIAPNKSTTINFIYITPDLMSHFIRGYFDGNGCVCIDNKQKKTISCDFTCGSENFATGLREHLHTLGINSFMLHEKENVYRVYVKGVENVHNFLCYIYQHADVYYLPRKYNKASTLYKEFEYARRLPLHSEMCGFLN